MVGFRFQKAKPIWIQNREKEMNCEVAFRAVIPSGEITLRMAASTIYRLFVNGNFVAAGPARTSHGFYCVDEQRLSKWLTQKENVVIIEVVGFNVNSYDTLNQPSFLTAEYMMDGHVIAWTGDSTVQAFDLKKRVQKVQRYSYQRAFAEAYHLRTEDRKFYIKADYSVKPEKCSAQAEKYYVERAVRMPQYEVLPVQALLETGSVDFEYICEEPIEDRSYKNIGSCLNGFTPQELEEHLSTEGQNMDFQPYENRIAENFPLKLCDEFTISA